MKPRATVAIFTFGIAFLQSHLCSGGLVFSLSPSMTTVSGPGPLIVPVDLVISHDGVGESSISGFAIDYAVSDGGSLQNDLSPSNPLGFDLTNISAGRVNFSSLLSNIDIGSDGSATVTTLNFAIPAAATGDFLISPTLFEAIRGGAFAPEDISSEVTVVGGSISVQAMAVPEPSSLALLCVGSAGLIVSRFRRHMERRVKD